MLANKYCEAVFDGTHETPKQVEFGHPLVTSKHIMRKKLDLSSAYHISSEDYHSIQRRSSVSQWDILFSMIGSVGEVYLEKSHKIPYAIKNIGVFSCKNESRAKWLYYYLQSPAAKSHIQRYLSGAVQKFLPLGALRSFPVQDFNSDSQDVIETLSCLDSKIDLNNRINTELEDVAKALYDYWFVQFDFPDKTGKPYKSSGGKMVWNAELKREIPEGWMAGILGQQCQITRGVTYNKEDVADLDDQNATPILRATNISNSEIDLKDMVYIPRNLVSNEQYLSMLDILIVMSSGSKDHIGKNAFYYFSKKTAYGAFCSKITPSNDYRLYVNVFMHSQFFKTYIRNYCLGTNINNLTNEHITECPLLIPDENCIAMFNEFSTPIFNKIGSNVRENHELADLRDWLLPMLMNGQVKVN
ncbi:MAG TPA: restriction endonuclease subunit S [bacterium]|nr:restriction endonuclease subunit S [bacterium]